MPLNAPDFVKKMIGVDAVKVWQTHNGLHRAGLSSWDLRLSAHVKAIAAGSRAAEHCVAQPLALHDHQRDVSAQYPR